MTNVILLSIEEVYASHERIIVFLRICYMCTNSINVESSIMQFFNIVLKELYHELLCIILESLNVAVALCKMDFTEK